MQIEETLLDPPITPAPIFAYRAIKGWFVGSPDSSPERDNKENLQSANLHPNSVVGKITPLLGPHKRKRDSDPVISPTKSILRTPGAATPRAKSLREVNVKFKSVSPDVGRKGPSTTIKDQAKTKHAEEIDQGVAASSKASPAKTIRAAAYITPQERTVDKGPIADVDYAELFCRTEKEMKRLIKHGHKWREVARQKDEENARLRLLLQEAQKENQRLEALLRRTGRTVEGANTMGKLVQERGKDVSGKTAVGRAVTAKGASTKSMKPAASEPADDDAVQDIEDLLDLTPPLEASNPSKPADQRSTPVLMTRPLAPSNPLPTRLSQTSVPQRPASISTSVPTHSPLTALQHRIEGSVPSTATRTNLPADRIAAVRKRLMAKEQARKAGLSVLDEIGDAGKQGFGNAGVGKGTEMARALEGSKVEVGLKKAGKQVTGETEESGFNWVGV